MLATKLSDASTGLFRTDDRSVEWAVSSEPIAYDVAVSVMEARAAVIASGRAPELIWLLEHPPLYTAGVSSKAGDLLEPERFPVYNTGRGGQYTYHGPGQRVVYVMIDLSERRRDVRAFVTGLETWVINALERLGVSAGLRSGRVGVWVDRVAQDGRLSEDKIAAVGVKIRRWVSFHGISVNIAPNLEHFSGIIPCGIRDHGVTSLADLGVSHTMGDADDALRAAFHRIFGPTVDADPPFDADPGGSVTEF